MSLIIFIDTIQEQHSQRRASAKHRQAFRHEFA